MEELKFLLVIVCTIALPICLGAYLLLINLRNQHQENMELLKQGIIPAPKSKSKISKYRALRNGMLCVGLGFGVIIALYICDLFNISKGPHLTLIAGSCLFFLGLAYCLFYLIVRNRGLDE